MQIDNMELAFSAFNELEPDIAQHELSFKLGAHWALNQVVGKVVDELKQNLEASARQGDQDAYHHIQNTVGMLLASLNQ